MWAKAKNSPAICCPYCGGDFEPEDLLFCDFDGDQVVDDQQYDAAYARFLSGIIPFVRVEKNNGFVEMAKRKKYYFHHWSDKNRKDMPFAKPLKEEWDRQNRLYPSTITVLRNNGLTPAREAGRQERAKAEPEAASRETEGLDDYDVGSFRRVPVKSASDGPNFSRDAESRLRTKACPHCHCILPENVGIYPVHRVVMLGSTRAGKTTYMTLAAHQLSSGVGLPAGLMKNSIIGEESKRYFDYLIGCMKAGVLPATPMINKDKIQVVFPIVVTVVPHGGIAPFFLVINDCPGEAMSNGAYLDNFSALSEVEGAILMMDPCQFSDRPREEVNRQAFGKGRVDVCGVAFNDTLSNFTQRIQEYTNLRQIAMTMTKLDLVYGANVERLIKPGDYPFLDEDDLKKQHTDGVDLDWIDQLSNQVSGAITRQLNYLEYGTKLASIQTERSDVEITTLCCSTQSWNMAEGRFVSAVKPTDDEQNVNMTGYRLLEPLLCVMGKCGWLPCRDEKARRYDGEDSGGGFFRRILGR